MATTVSQKQRALCWLSSLSLAELEAWASLKQDAEVSVERDWIKDHGGVRRWVALIGKSEIERAIILLLGGK